LSTTDVDNVGNDDELFESMDPRETIKKGCEKGKHGTYFIG
jgi:hypothetical protein